MDVNIDQIIITLTVNDPPSALHFAATDEVERLIFHRHQRQIGAIDLGGVDFVGSAVNLRP